MHITLDTAQQWKSADLLNGSGEGINTSLEGLDNMLLLPETPLIIQLSEAGFSLSQLSWMVKLMLLHHITLR